MLNVENLRRVALRRSIPSVNGDTETLDIAEMNRREFIGLVAATAATNYITQPVLSWKLSSSQCEFFVNQQSLWVISTARFSGTPRLLTREYRDGIDVELTRATFPGLDLPADLKVMARKVDDKWLLRLHFAFTGTHTDCDFISWLCGRDKPIECPSSREWIVELGTKSELSLRPKIVQFTPDWRFTLRGNRISSLSGFGGELSSDLAEIRLLEGGDPSLMTVQLARRMTISLQRGAEVWKLRPKLPKHEHGEVVAGPNSFDHVLIESGEAIDGSVHRAASVQSLNDQRSIRFRPSEPFAISGQKRFSFPVLHAAYGRTLSPGGSDAVALTGKVEPNDLWVHGEGFSALISSPQGGRIEVTATDGCIETCRIDANVKQVAVPLDGVIVRPDQGCSLSSIKSPGLPWWTILSRKKRTCLPADLTKSIRVIRHWDLLDLTFDFDGFELILGEKKRPELVPVGRKTADSTPRITVTFPPQNIAERAFFRAEPSIPVARPPRPDGTPRPRDPDANTGNEQPHHPVEARSAGYSRLVFRVDSKVEYSLEGLFDWSKWTPVLSPLALESEQRNLGPVTDKKEIDHVTALELPYRLFVSPHKNTVWAHSGVLVCDPSREQVELWHTQLAPGGAKDRIERRVPRALRAIWSPDYKGTATAPMEGPRPFRMPMDAFDRHQIVRLTADYRLNTEAKTYTAPVDVNLLILSSRGAWMNTRGSWDPPTSLVLEEWVHEMTEASDHYVRLVYKGYCFPWGHRASLIKVTERRFESSQQGNVAYLRQRMYVVIRHKEKSFPAVGQPFLGRQLPFRNITFVTAQTPDLAAPIKIVTQYPGYNFWIEVPNPDEPTRRIPYLFEFEQKSQSGSKSTVRLPAIFIDNNIAHNQDLTAIHREYASRIDRRTVDVRGQVVGYTENQKASDTDFETNEFVYQSQRFGEEATTRLNPMALLEADQPPFYPAMQQAKIRLRSIENMTGRQSLAQISFQSEYLNYGFSPEQNRGEVYARISDLTPVFINFGGDAGNMDRSGGAVAPNQRAVGLSRRLGLVGGSRTDESQALSDALVRLDQIVARRTEGAETESTPNLSDIFDLAAVSPYLGSALLQHTRTANLLSLRQSALSRADLDSVRNALITTQAAAVQIETSISAVAKGRFDPLEYFSGALAEAKVLGVVKLWDILRPAVSGILDNLDEAPKLIEKVQYGISEAGRGAQDEAARAIQSALAELDSLPQLEALKRKLAPHRTNVEQRLAAIVAAPNQVEKAILWPETLGGLRRFAAEVESVINSPSTLVQETMQRAATSFLQQTSGPTISLVGSISQWQGWFTEIRSVEEQIGFLPLNARQRLTEVYQRVTESRERLTTELARAGHLQWTSLIEVESSFLSRFDRLRDELKKLDLQALLTNPVATAQTRLAISSVLSDILNRVERPSIQHSADLQRIWEGSTEDVKEQTRTIYVRLLDDLQALEVAALERAGEGQLALLRLQASFLQTIEQLRVLLASSNHPIWTLVRSWPDRFTIAAFPVATRQEVLTFASQLTNVPAILVEDLRNRANEIGPDLAMRSLQGIEKLIAFRDYVQEISDILGASRPEALRRLHEIARPLQQNRTELQQNWQKLSQQLQNATQNIKEDILRAAVALEQAATELSTLRAQAELLGRIGQLLALLPRHGNDATGDLLRTFVTGWIAHFTILRQAQTIRQDLELRAIELSGDAASQLRNVARDVGSHLIGGNLEMALDLLIQTVGQPSIQQALQQRADEVRRAITVMQQRVTTIENLARSSRDTTRQAASQLQNTIGTLHAQLTDSLKQEFAVSIQQAQAQLNRLAQNLAAEAADVVTTVLIRELPPALEILRKVANPLLEYSSSSLLIGTEVLAYKRRLEQLVNRYAIPDRIETDYTFEPQLKPFPGSSPLFDPTPDGKLSIKTQVAVYAPTTEPVRIPTVSVTGRLEKFAIHLAPSARFISIRFRTLNLSVAQGSSPRVTAEIEAVELGQSLGFLRKLQEALSPKQGPFVEFDSLVIRTGYRFQVPGIQLGAFALRDLAFSVGATLSLRGDAMRVRMAVSERHKPFVLSSGIFGGAGFFGMTLGLDGLEALEGSLEFGVTAQISIAGIASGYGFIRAGFYFGFERMPLGNGLSSDRTTLCGFVRAGGHLSIIGLISITLDIYVSVCWVKEGGRDLVRGEAEIRIEIEMFFFSITVSARARYTFAGSEGTSQTLTATPIGLPEALRPEFLDLETPSDWIKYRRTFAPVAPLEV